MPHDIRHCGNNSFYELDPFVSEIITTGERII